MFSERLRQLRTERRLTQDELASKINVSPKTIGAWERNDRKPPVEAVSELAEYFDVSTDFLLGHSSTRQAVDLDKPGAILRFDGKPIPEEDLEIIKRLIRGARDGHE